MPNAVAFPKCFPPRKPMTWNVRETFPRRTFCRAVGGTAVKRTKQTFVTRHPSQTNTEYYSNRSGRSRRLPPGYQYIYNPRALARNVVPLQQRARVNQVRPNRFALQYIQHNSPMVTDTCPLTHHRYTYVHKPRTANGGHEPL